MRLSSHLGRKDSSLSNIARQIMNRGASPRPCLRFAGDQYHPTHAAWHRRDILPIRRFGETLGTPAAQAKLMVLGHYLTEVR